MSDATPDENEAAPLAAAGARSPGERVLDQAEIDRLSGYAPAFRGGEVAGVRAVAEGGAGPREPLPMLAHVLGDLARRLSGSLRDLFAGDVDVRLSSLEPVRYGSFVEDLILPAQAVVFRAEGWDGAGLVAMGPDFGWLVLDALLGASRAATAGRVASRPFSQIEGAILLRLADAVLNEAGGAFGPIGPVAFRRERSELDPRLAAVAADGELAYAATFLLTLGGRSASFAIVLPAATLESVRGRLRESFPGLPSVREDYWSGHLATEVWQAAVEAEAVLHETALPLRRVLGLAIGDTLMFDMRPTDPVELRCGGVTLTRGRMGRVDGRIAVQILEPVERHGRGRETRVR